jgi:hypothetical protein
LLHHLPNGVNTPFWIGVSGVHAMDGQGPKVGQAPKAVNCGIVGVQIALAPGVGQMHMLL